MVSSLDASCPVLPSVGRIVHLPSSSPFTEAAAVAFVDVYTREEEHRVNDTVQQYHQLSYTV